MVRIRRSALIVAATGAFLVPALPAHADKGGVPNVGNNGHHTGGGFGGGDAAHVDNGQHNGNAYGRIK